MTTQDDIVQKELQRFKALTTQQEQRDDLIKTKAFIDQNAANPSISVCKAIFEAQRTYYETQWKEKIDFGSSVSTATPTEAEKKAALIKKNMLIFSAQSKDEQLDYLKKQTEYLDYFSKEKPADEKYTIEKENFIREMLALQIAEYEAKHGPSGVISPAPSVKVSQVKTPQTPTGNQGAGDSKPDTSAPAESLGDKARKFGSSFMSAVQVSGNDPVTNMVNSGTDFVITGAGQLVSGAAAGLKTMHGTRGGRAVIREAGAGIAALIASAAFISPMLDKLGIGNIPIIGSLVKLVALGAAFLAARKGIHEAQNAYGPALADSQGEGNHLPNDAQTSARNQQSQNGDTPVRVNPANDNAVNTDAGRIPTQLNPNDVGNRCAQSNDVSRPSESGSVRPNVRFPRDCRMDGLACTGHTSGSGQPAEMGEIVFDADGSLPPGRSPKIAMGR